MLGFFAEKLAAYIPFSVENKITSTFDLTLIGDDKSKNPHKSEIENYLQKIVDQLSITQQLPAEMKITVHYLNNETINAFATLGGHIFFYRGLLEKMPNENTLAMVLAHEIAHVKHRHPITSMSRSVILSLVMFAVIGSTENDTLGNILGNTSLITTLNFSRDMEREADNSALASIVKYYGHTEGSNTLFKIFQSYENNSLAPPEFFSSHPVTKNRIKNIGVLAIKNKWETTGKLTELPVEFQNWLVVEPTPKSPSIPL